MKKRWMVALALLCAASVQAEEPTPLPLASAMRLALGEAPALKQAAAGRMAGRYQKRVGLAAVLPIIRAQGRLLQQRQRYHYDRPLPFLATGFSTRSTEIELLLVQPLVRLDRWAMKSLGVQADLLAQTALEAARARWLMEVVRAWADFAAAQQALAAAQARVQAAEQAAQSAQAKKRLGMLTEAEASAAQAAYEQARAAELAAQQRLQLAKEALASLIGRRSFVLPKPFSWPRLVDGLDEAQVHAAPAKALAVRLAEQQWQLAQMETKKALGSALPGLDLVAGWQWQNTTKTVFGTGQKATNQWVGLQLEVPIYAGGGAWAEYDRKKALAEAQRWALEEARRKALLAAQQTKASLAMLDARIKALSDALAAAQKAAKSAHAAFELGAGRVQDWLDAEARRMALASELSDAHARRLQAEAEWLALMGTIGQGLAE